MRLYRLLAVPIGQGLTLADITEANYSGYAGVVSTLWGVATLDVDDLAQKVSPVLTFAHNGGPTGNNVYGWYLTRDVPGPSALIAIQAFPTPRSMWTGLDSFSFSARVAIRQGV